MPYLRAASRSGFIIVPSSNSISLKLAVFKNICLRVKLAYLYNPFIKPAKTLLNIFKKLLGKGLIF